MKFFKKGKKGFFVGAGGFLAPGPRAVHLNRAPIENKRGPQSMGPRVTPGGEPGGGWRPRAGGFGGKGFKRPPFPPGGSGAGAQRRAPSKGNPPTPFTKAAEKRGGGGRGRGGPRGTQIKNVCPGISGNKGGRDGDNGGRVFGGGAAVKGEWPRGTGRRQKLGHHRRKGIKIPGKKKGRRWGTGGAL